MPGTVHTLPRASSAPIPTTASVRTAYGVPLSQPAGVAVYTFTRNHDASVYRLGLDWRVQVGGVTAPIDERTVDAFATLVGDIGTARITPTCARRFLALLPGAFIFAP